MTYPATAIVEAVWLVHILYYFDWMPWGCDTWHWMHLGHVGQQAMTGSWCVTGPKLGHNQYFRTERNLCQPQFLSVIASLMLFHCFALIAFLLDLRYKIAASKSNLFPPSQPLFLPFFSGLTSFFRTLNNDDQHKSQLCGNSIHIKYSPYPCLLATDPFSWHFFDMFCTFSGVLRLLRCTFTCFGHCSHQLMCL